ncbi:hypothetical protein QF117_10565 [Vibrio sp. YMD68]|uniref:hypothetical protein n=1 Tax=Vibrio sp. YMD68 TaxID=3042300 RepID=UPI00249A28AD|nr:hypothetical protein [Vibrio sp. YMD68]WGV98841.1 hypothetical protein QF117_02445 [Vibrio sp. YMD68]WGW01232.1 hypothetical protein QF117_10565 [Vibrio sp. YMD68]
MSIKQSHQLSEALQKLRKLNAHIIGFRIAARGRCPVVYIQKPSHLWLINQAQVLRETPVVRWYEVSFYLCSARWFERCTSNQQQRGKAS